MGVPRQGTLLRPTNLLIDDTADPIVGLFSFVRTSNEDAAMSTEHLNNAADWHATMALKAYRKKDLDLYIRHIRIADQLRSI